MKWKKKHRHLIYIVISVLALALITCYAIKEPWHSLDNQKKFTRTIYSIFFLGYLVAHVAYYYNEIKKERNAKEVE